MDGGPCDWEVNRRAGHDYELLPPEASIDPSNDAVSIDTSIAIRALFTTDDMPPVMIKFFDTLATRAEALETTSPAIARLVLIRNTYYLRRDQPLGLPP